MLSRIHTILLSPPPSSQRHRLPGQSRVVAGIRSVYFFPERYFMYSIKYRSSHVTVGEAMRSARQPKTTATVQSSSRSLESGMYITCPGLGLTHTRLRLNHISTTQL